MATAEANEGSRWFEERPSAIRNAERSETNGRVSRDIASGVNQAVNGVIDPENVDERFQSFLGGLELFDDQFADKVESYRNSVRGGDAINSTLSFNNLTYQLEEIANSDASHPYVRALVNKFLQDSEPVRFNDEQAVSQQLDQLVKNLGEFSQGMVDLHETYNAGGDGREYNEKSKALAEKMKNAAPEFDVSSMEDESLTPEQVMREFLPPADEVYGESVSEDSEESETERATNSAENAEQSRARRAAQEFAENAGSPQREALGEAQNVAANQQQQRNVLALPVGQERIRRVSLKNAYAAARRLHNEGEIGDAEYVRLTTTMESQARSLGMSVNRLKGFLAAPHDWQGVGGRFSRGTLNFGDHLGKGVIGASKNIAIGGTLGAVGGMVSALPSATKAGGRSLWEVAATPGRIAKMGVLAPFAALRSLVKLDIGPLKRWGQKEVGGIVTKPKNNIKAIATETGNAAGTFAKKSGKAFMDNAMTYGKERDKRAADAIKKAKRDIAEWEQAWKDPSTAGAGGENASRQLLRELLADAVNRNGDASNENGEQGQQAA